MTTQQTVKCTSKELMLLILGNEMNNGAHEFCTFVSKTKPELNKKDRVTKEPLAFEGVYKITKGKAGLKAIYENAVNRELNKTGEVGDFTAQKLPFGQDWYTVEADGLTKTSKIVTVVRKAGEADKFYLRLTFRDKTAPCTSEYFDKNGQSIPKEKLVNFLDKPKAVQTVVTDSGDEKDIDPVIVRGYGLESMQEMTFGGVHYIVEN